MRLPVDPNSLQLLAVLLRECNVSTAAEMLGISQPSASRGLARLRDSLGDPLLIRSGAGMVRTRRGDELVERLGEWMAATATLLADDEFSPARLQRRFRIATTDFGVMSVLAPAMKSLWKDAPGVGIDIVPLTRTTQRLLASGEIDLAISGLDHDSTQLHDILLFQDGFACVFSADHPLAESGARPLPLSEFLAYPHLGLTVSDAELDRVVASLGPVARNRVVAANLPYFGLAPELVLTGNLLMTVPERAAARLCRDDRLARREAPSELGHLDYRLLWHERTQRDPASVWLRNRLAEACV